MEIDLDLPLIGFGGNTVQVQTGVKTNDDGSEEPIYGDQTLGDLILIGLSDRPGETLGPREKVRLYRLSMLADEGGTIEVTPDDHAFIIERSGREGSGLSALGYGWMCSVIGGPDESGPAEPTAPAKRPRKAPAKKPAAKKAAARKRR